MNLRKFSTQQGKDLLLAGLHPRRFCGTAALMIIAKKMKDAVQQQEIEFAGQREAGFRRIAGRGSGRDHHIAEEKSFPTDLFAFLLGKRDNIGRLVPLQVVPVDLADPPVADNENRQLGVRTSRDA